MLLDARHIVAVDIVLADSIHIQLQKQNLQLIVISVGGKLTMQASTLYPKQMHSM